MGIKGEWYRLYTDKFGRQNGCSEEPYKLFAADYRLWVGSSPTAPTIVRIVPAN